MRLLKEQRRAGKNNLPGLSLLTSTVRETLRCKLQQYQFIIYPPGGPNLCIVFDNTTSTYVHSVNFKSVVS